MKIRVLLSSLLFASALHSVEIPADEYAQSHPAVQSPWFTGPLLAPSAQTIPPGHYNIEPYINVFANIGHYGSNWKGEKRQTFWVNQLQPSLQFGINSWMDIQINPTLTYNYTKGAGHWVIGDMPVFIDIQLFRTSRLITQSNHALKLAIKEILPFGKYQNLNPQKQLTDSGGGGSWQTGLALDWGSMFYLGGIHFATWRTSLLYTIPAPVRVKNLNTYGGGEGTSGTVYPAQNFLIDTAVEFNFTRNWVFAMDVVASWSGRGRFKGKTVASMTSPPSAQFSLAPALEYNWNAQLGIIFGSWFTVAGRNAVQFTSGIIALNYYH